MSLFFFFFGSVTILMQSERQVAVVASNPYLVDALTFSFGHQQSALSLGEWSEHDSLSLYSSHPDFSVHHIVHPYYRFHGGGLIEFISQFISRNGTCALSSM